MGRCSGEMSDQEKVSNEERGLVTDRQLERVIEALPKSGKLDVILNWLQLFSSTAAIFAVFWAAWGNQELLAKIQVLQTTSVVVDYSLDVKAFRTPNEYVSVNVDTRVKNNGTLSIGINSNSLYLWIGVENEADSDVGDFPILQINRPGEIGRISWKKQLVDGYAVFDSVQFVGPGLEEAKTVSWEIKLPLSYKYICVTSALATSNNLGVLGLLRKKTEVIQIK